MQYEALEQEAVVKYCEYNRIPIFAIPNGGKRNRIEAAKLKRQGVKPGVPDIFLPAPRDGYVRSINAQEVGGVCLRLGGGRVSKESGIDLSVGVQLRARVGSFVRAGEPLAEIHASDEVRAEAAVRELTACYTLGEQAPEARPLIYGVVR